MVIGICIPIVAFMMYDITRYELSDNKNRFAEISKEETKQK